jgi:DNA-binding beta-propeller fold protein YncE
MCGSVSKTAKCSLGSSASYVAQCGGFAPPERGLCLEACERNSECSSSKTCSNGVCVAKSYYPEPLSYAEPALPAISGGTLTLINAGQLAAVADPDEDVLHIVDVVLPRVTTTVRLGRGDEPGRIVEDGRGFIHVVLRRGGAVTTIDPRTGNVLLRRSVCQYPRGIAHDPITDLLHVACVDGELISMPARGGAPVRTLKLDDDLRDVIVDGKRLLVSRFRSAELLVLDADGKLIQRLVPQLFEDITDQPKQYRPAVAWRTIPAFPDGVLMVHQQLERGTSDPEAEAARNSRASSSRPRSSEPGEAWTASTGFLCRGPLRAALTLFRPDNTAYTTAVLPTVLPVDVAVNRKTGEAVVPSAAARPASIRGRLTTTGRTLSVVHALTSLQKSETSMMPNHDAFCNQGWAGVLQADSQIVAVAHDANGRLVAQTRDPATVLIDGAALPLPSRNQRDTGHELFHLGTIGGLACASCHPEGRDDGHTWFLFEQHAPRRTQSLAGGIAGTEPLHWGGEHVTLHSLAGEVMAESMQGPSLRSEQVAALEWFINSIPAWKPPRAGDWNAVSRGRTVFAREDVGCETCHSGERLTNNETMDVGTGEALQVPSLLGLTRRAPYMHNGCALTIADRFTSCGGGDDQHGVISHLSSSELTDLVAYLNSL